MLASSGERMPPCGVPVLVPLTAPSSERIPAIRNAFTKPSDALVPDSIAHPVQRAECEISSKHEAMSPSSTHS